MRRISTGLYSETYRDREVVLSLVDGRWFAYVDRVLIEDWAGTRLTARRWAHEQIDREETTDA